MLRRKYLAGNLKREKERTIARYFESFLSNVRDDQNGVSLQNNSRDEDNVTKGNAIISESAKKEATDTQVKVSNKSQGAGKSVAIKLTALDRPGTSRSPDLAKQKQISKSGQCKVKSIETKATQMRQSLSAQRLQGDDDIDDDSSFVDENERKQKYVLVGWDNFRSKLMLFLLVLLILWAVIYFPLIGT